MGEDDSGFTLEAVDVGVYTVPTEQPEADGTLAWDSTTVVVVGLDVRNTAECWARAGRQAALGRRPRPCGGSPPSGG